MITCKNGAAVFVRFRGVSEVFAGRRSGRGEWVRIGGGWLVRGDGAAVRFGWGADGLPDRVRRGAGECAAVRSERVPPKKNQKMFLLL